MIYVHFIITKSLQVVTLEKAWSGHKLSVTHLRVFGYMAYAILDARRTKFDDKKEKCIFV